MTLSPDQLETHRAYRDVSVCITGGAGFIGSTLAHTLVNLGARIVLCDPHRAVVAGHSKLRGGVVRSPDIRAGMAVLLAALAAEGESVIYNVSQIDRGYERIDDRLRGLGCRIERLD